MFIVDLVGHVKICFPSMEHGAHKLKTLGWVALLPLQNSSLLPLSTEIVIAHRKNRAAELKNLELGISDVFGLMITCMVATVLVLAFLYF